MNKNKLVIFIAFLVMLSVTTSEAVQAVMASQEAIDVVMAYFAV